MNTLREQAILIADISDRPNFPSIKRKIWDKEIYKGIEDGSQTPIIEVMFVVEHWIDNQWTENDIEIKLSCKDGEILSDGHGSEAEPFNDILNALKLEAVHLKSVFSQWVGLRDVDGTINNKLIAIGVYKS
jgi:hypothetical protein